MLKPTQDQSAKAQIEGILEAMVSTGSHDVKLATKTILLLMETKGYHIGLPSNIEEALNSGDGAYRP